MDNKRNLIFRILVGATAVALLSLVSCSDPIVVGSDLFDGDQASVDFTDTLKVVTHTVRGDSVRTYSPFTSQQLRSYRCGRLEDPVFGITESSVYVQPLLSRLKPNFVGSVLDSIVLVLPYDSTGFYGSLDESFGLEVLRITEDIPTGVNYYSNRKFETEAIPLGAVSYTPSLDSLEVVAFDDGDRDTIRFPHLRIPLDLAFGQELLSYDTTITSSDTTFLQSFKGLHIRPTTSNGGLVSFNLITSAEAGLILYYTEPDLDEEQFKFQFLASSVRVINYEYDYAGSLVEPYLDGTADNDSLIFLQGLAGMNVRLEIPGLRELGDVAVNFAELEISVASLPGDDPDVYGGVEQMLLYSQVDDQVFPVVDLGIFESRGVSIPNTFGGVPIERPGEPDVYRFNITAQLQRMLERDDSEIMLLLAGRLEEELSSSIPYKASRAWRSTLYGGGHPLYPVRLKVAFTRL